jgi:hypothetical protein
MWNITYIVLLLCWLVSIHGWNEWKYKTQWSESNSDRSAKIANWQEYWGVNAAPGFQISDQNAPRPRRGHTMLSYYDKTVSALYNGATMVIMFGGRDNEAKYEHIPRTYNVAKVNGTIVFTTYRDKPVNACNDIEEKYYTTEERAGCNFTESSRIDVGIFYNDVWAYKLCEQSPEPLSTPGFGPLDGYNRAALDPTRQYGRYFDEPCEGGGWLLLHPGAPEGGCVIQLGILVCNVPSERYNHAAAMFDDGTFYVYGGFSQRCADYCDDLWLFDIFLKGWRQVYAGDSQYNLSKLYYDLFLGFPFEYTTKEVPRDTSVAKNAGPGRRWRHKMDVGKQYPDTAKDLIDGTIYNVMKQDCAVFGGHRLWQGYSVANQESNNWGNYDLYPSGGYLDDLWIYSKFLDFVTTPGETFKTNDGKWQFVFPKEECYSDPGLSWEARFDVSCFTVWPLARAGHGIAMDSARNGLWIFGGYSTYYPYLKTDGEGSGAGVTQLNKGGFIPYPGFSYWKNDLWFYNRTSGYWKEHVYNAKKHSQWPKGREDHVFLLLGELLFLHGGFSDNNFFDDTWYYNITTEKWLEKERFVYPTYPDECTDDLEYIAKHNCTHMLWPKHLDRDVNYPFSVLPYSQQEAYWPDSNFGPYWDIKPKDFDQNPYTVDKKTGKKIYNKKLQFDNFPQKGRPMFPYAATGPMQYVKPFVYSFNSTHNGTFYEHCTSAYGEPTRGKITDGKVGRAHGPILVPQPRRKRPGWDGCSGRQDKRTDLPNKLQYEKPTARSNHDAVWFPETNEIIMYGGMSYLQENAARSDETWPTRTRDDMWYYALNHCINNCSDHGVCRNGFCTCYVGYYGEDCSNTSCPGTSCYYDEYTNDQVCVHACQAGYVHTDADKYVQDITKIPCSPKRSGEINGICDGFGKTQCAPPFIGDDCGTKDCKNNCSFNGWCSIEYPNSRCMCQPGYFGETCEHKLCLNNCSYPNGVCDTKSGFCKCRDMYSPFNQTRKYHPWGGEDCSWIYAYQGAGKNILSNSMYLASLLVLGVSLILSSPSLFWSRSSDTVSESATKLFINADNDNKNDAFYKRTDEEVMLFLNEPPGLETKVEVFPLSLSSTLKVTE